MGNVPDSVWLAVWRDVERRIELLRNFADRFGGTGSMSVSIVNQKKEVKQMIDWMKQNGLSVDSLEKELDQIDVPAE
ncbi:hypothetical protein CathTA2_2427 [Caldalkalibacillus thermarum TA2.A1]|uniref:Uncharacterized protein n=1 Tax=Caldalkalibacillus thermarum (strain TA2.A1) TaxID=986075 RepID=F5L9C2_CALTT|nr:hypothetical protein [Caldalkalibacillus thermarum]EGL82064.1 hypothetical protein CathTA2_2427 [Caldalkalibacillus thermarum TA2.A1]QZT34017.1 hypothetical protein HUR95_00835 [Caldalkalibacillus thermarum TA2.A1]